MSTLDDVLRRPCDDGRVNMVGAAVVAALQQPPDRLACFPTCITQVFCTRVTHLAQWLARVPLSDWHSAAAPLLILGSDWRRARTAAGVCLTAPWTHFEYWSMLVVLLSLEKKLSALPFERGFCSLRDLHTQLMIYPAAVCVT